MIAWHTPIPVVYLPSGGLVETPETLRTRQQKL